ncbi:MAG: hypothetical protein WAR78_03695 [Ferruginibacter sp.]
MDNSKNIQQKIDQYIQEERNTAFNPFLSTRILAAIDKKDKAETYIVLPAWKTAVVAISLALALFTGIATGNLYQSNNKEPDVVLMNDNRMENFGFFNEMENE